MIAFLVGLAIVSVLGGAVVKHIKDNPDTMTQYRRAQKQASKPAGKRTGPSRSWIVAKATGAVLWKAGESITPKAMEARRAEKAKAAHEQAKAASKTAATGGVTSDKRGLTGAWADLKESLFPQAEVDDPPTEPVPAVPAKPAASPLDLKPTEPKPLDVMTNVPCDTCGKANPVTLKADENGTSTTCSCGTEIHVIRKLATDKPAAPTTDPTASRPEEARKGIRMTSLVNLFETGDMLANPVFEHVFQIEVFTKTLAGASHDASAMYFNLATRMEGPMSIDPIVTEPIRRCGTHQIQIQAAVNDASVNLGAILAATTEQLLERGIRVPKPELLNGDSRMEPHIPIFFETARTVAGRTYGDVREVHCLIKGLRVASEHQTVMYKKVALKLQDENVDASVVEQYLLAARHQEAISMALADGDANMTKLLTMTVRELAASSLRAPNANLIGV